MFYINQVDLTWLDSSFVTHEFLQQLINKADGCVFSPSSPSAVEGQIFLCDALAPDDSDTLLPELISYCMAQQSNVLWVPLKNAGREAGHKCGIQWMGIYGAPSRHPLHEMPYVKPGREIRPLSKPCLQFALSCLHTAVAVHVEDLWGSNTSLAVPLHEVGHHQVETWSLLGSEDTLWPISLQKSSRKQSPADPCPLLCDLKWHTKETTDWELSLVYLTWTENQSYSHSSTALKYNSGVFVLIYIIIV